MNNQDLYKAVRGYWTANAVVGSAASKMAELIYSAMILLVLMNF